MNEMKLCKDCKHVKIIEHVIDPDYFCTVPGTLNLVDGTPYLAHKIRYDEAQCGIRGRWWAERPTQGDER